jgi:hypothetical protein
MCGTAVIVGGGLPTRYRFESGYVGQEKKVTVTLKKIVYSEKMRGFPGLL